MGAGSSAGSRRSRRGASVGARSRLRGEGAEAMGQDLAEPIASRTPGRRLLLWPLIIFGGLALLFAVALRSGDPSRLPSALIGKHVPEINFAALAGLNDGSKPIGGFAAADL